MWRENIIFRGLKHLHDEGVLTILGLLWLILLLGGGAVYLFDRGSDGHSITNIFDAFWWAWVTMTTVGYGDLTPHSTTAKIAASIMMFFSVALISFFTATISSIFVARKIREGRGLEKVNYHNHFIICGWNENAERMLEVLFQQAKGAWLQVVLVNDLPIEKIQDLTQKFKSYDLAFVRGDFTKEQTLRNANVDKARAVFILPSQAAVDDEDADEKTTLTTYSIKAIAPKVKVYVYLRLRENRTNLRRAKADGIVVADEFSDFLSAVQLLKPGLPLFLSEVMRGTDQHLTLVPVPRQFIEKPYRELFFDFREQKGQTVLGVYSEEESMGVDQFLSAESGDYLDAFIARKLKESGRTLSEEVRTNLRINPPDDYILTERDQIIVLQ
ncbi:MAG: NAD-binding protein [Lentisphaeria bacterium]|nr:NAD-binding protein [Candidatus Neomarinimicrobiota bacterium]MCF7843187.1 NAD-binding protein [Lentisphaeria bacterium]